MQMSFFPSEILIMSSLSIPLINVFSAGTAYAAISPSYLVLKLISKLSPSSNGRSLLFCELKSELIPYELPKEMSAAFTRQVSWLIMAS